MYKLQSPQNLESLCSLDNADLCLIIYICLSRYPYLLQIFLQPFLGPRRLTCTNNFKILVLPVFHWIWPVGNPTEGWMEGERLLRIGSPLDPPVGWVCQLQVTAPWPSPTTPQLAVTAPSLCASDLQITPQLLLSHKL